VRSTSSELGVILSNDLDMSATVASATWNFSRFKSGSIQFVWSAGSSPVGSFTLEGSVDGTNWVTVDSTLAQISGNTGSQLIDIPFSGLPALRGKYTRVSGSATLDVYVFGKEV